MNEDSEPKWICKVQALYLHEKTIEIQGRLSGIRVKNYCILPLPALKIIILIGKHDRFVLAAHYAGGIARNHPFANGNKRTAYETADFFLYQNG